MCAKFSHATFVPSGAETDGRGGACVTYDYYSRHPDTKVNKSQQK